MNNFRLIIFDLDNTIYDWYSAFIPAFYQMVEIASVALHCDRQLLLSQLRDVHIKHGDVEHPFSLLETEIVKEQILRDGLAVVSARIDPAFHAFNRIRKKNFKLFPETKETLQKLKMKNIKLIAYTDSKYHAAVWRLARLGISELFLQTYCRKKSDTMLPADFPNYPVSEDVLAKVIELPSFETKPNPHVLADIIEAQQERIENSAYVGDSISKDILMAKKAGCFSVWAKYGTHVDQTMYEQLVQVSHWTKADIVRERNYVEEAKNVAPDFICSQSISEILSIL